MEPLLKTHDLAFARGRRSILEGISLQIAAGELVAVTGENGSGKSTLLALLAGVLRPDRGFVARASGFGYCPQSTGLYPYLSADEHFALYAAARNLSRREGTERAALLMERFAFAHERRRRAGELSGGTQQKLSLALALLHDPPLLLLDEPYAGFDRRSYGQFVTWAREARERGSAIVVVSHLAHDPSLFDRRLALSGGRLDDAGD